GMPLRSLYEIASGGEMSRIMLAIKTILSGRNSVETLIFDEIDTGIGGLVLSTVADKLEALSQREQVICVTHATSIAARADQNFYIQKYAENGMTETHVQALDSEDAVIRELARMSGSTESWQLENAARVRAQKKFHH
ncbi:MAG: DNA repair protein RecN, partial [Peptococcaceae bacterium]|nr:DNA repair protein RecN [Peptococcaceae bacterium]